MKISLIGIWAIALTTYYGIVSAQLAPSPGPVVGFGPSAGGPVAFGPSGAAAPTDPCFTSLLNMTDCLGYVSPGSTDTKPDKACCPELAGLVESSPACLCELLGNPGKIGITIDLNRALKLPSACRVTTPSVSLCSVFGYNIGVPAGEPTPSQEAFSPGAMPPGVAATPTTGGKSGASSTRGSSIALFVAFAATFLSAFF